MERNEPELVPEWLKSTGTVSGGGNSSHRFASSTSHSDVSSSMHRGRSRNSRNISDFDSPRLAFLDRVSSLNSWSSRNVSSRHTYRSFNRSHRDKDRERNKDSMAVALAQAPSPACTSPQSSVSTQRREEMAIKQSRQLIPVTPSMPKGSVLNSVDKPKAKPGLRTRWENGVSLPTQKDTASPSTVANSRVFTSQHVIAPVSSAAARNSNNTKISVGERKVAPLNPITGFTVEKRPSLAQTQSRNDFFNNLKKKKTPSNSSAGHSDSDPQISSCTIEKPKDTKEVVGASVAAHANENGTGATSNGDVCQELQRFSNDDEKDFSSSDMVYPDEEEAAFLRSLGWEENSAEDGGLTEEEINAFLQKHRKTED
ncbi:hypothetical protein V6N12_070564 [Hibiscus sabdariffa]|uniref:Uncharacterized protein n=1 Tax=Hibiscus sabdariffa TaxID=183260 RepID=A0ABR2FHB4_9ROSI